MNLAMLLFSFQGRLNRAKYWLAALIYLGADLSCRFYRLFRHKAWNFERDFFDRRAQ